jgi:type I restriction enzyme S subunit
MSKLPMSWALGQLAQAAHVVRGITFPAGEKRSDFAHGYICCLRTTNVQQTLEWGDVYYVPTNYVKRDDQIVRQGDVLMSMANSYELVGKVARADSVPQRAAFGAFLAAVRPTSAIDGGYLYHFLRSSEVQSKLREGSSQTTNIANISAGRLSELPVPLAPLEEQKRIAEKLNTVLTRVDAVNSRLARVASLLKRFRQSVLAAATSGRLTEDWRNSAGVSSAWQTTEVQSVAQVGTGSTPLRSNPAFFSPTGTPWVTSAATSSEIVNEANEYVTPEAIAAHRLKVFPVGTLLVAMYGEGKTRGQVTQLGIPATINQACAAVVVDESKMSRDFVKLALQANYLEMRVLAEGGNQPNLNLAKVKSFPLPLPSREEQTEIVRRVETLFAFADRLEARLQTAQTAADRLTPSLLAKAFRGELVPQDPNDEPASELLKRLAATSAYSTAPKRGRAKASTAA